MKYRKKPVVIDAFKLTYQGISDLQKWVSSFGDEFTKWFEFTDQGPDGGSLKVHTLEGTSYNTKPGEYVIRGVNGEYYPCKPDIFAKTYESADETPEPTRQGAEAPFPDRMTFKEMLSNLFDVSFLTGEELETISKAGEMYANGCLKAQSFSAQSEGERWVSVEEGLPEESDATDPEEGTPYLTMPHYRVITFYDGRFWHWDNDLENFFATTITHWRPLPDPPKA